MRPPAELEVVIAIAQDAAKLVRSGYGQAERRTKTAAGEKIRGWDPVEAVTECDRDAQRLIVSRLRDRFPEDGVIGEESEDGHGITHNPARAGHRVWVIDPIDGTNNFISGLGCFAVCIALLDHGLPVLGVVLDVTRGNTYSAIGGMAWLDGERIHAARTPMSDQSLLMLTCNLLDRSGSLPGFITRWLTSAPWKLRMLGSAALEAVQVAVGVAHGAITVNSKLWDIAAPAAVVLAAGGRVTDLTGNNIFPFNATGYDGRKVPFLVAGPEAHATLLSEIQFHGWPVSS